MIVNQRAVRVVVLAVLTALPLSGTVCAMLCDSPASKTASTHHTSGKNCEALGGSSADLQIQARAGHNCSTHEAVVRQAASTPAQPARAVLAPLLSTTPAHSSSKVLMRFEPDFDCSAPPGTAPPTITPLVLRI